MSNRNHEPVPVSVIARDLLSRLERSSRVLASDVEYKCEVCYDTGFILDEGKRYAPCHTCRKADTQPSGMSWTR